VIVVDASAALSALLNDGAARQTLGTDQLHVPHLIDLEVANGLRRMVSSRQLDDKAGWKALDVFRRLGLTRYPAFAMIDRVWELRDNVSAYNAAYVALAELLNCPLLTADARLSRVAGIRCAVTVVPA
jgi:predicted nucleic acid-binding protein